MHKIPTSEFILNQRGAVYHLDLLPAEIAPLIITVGDPDRVPQVSRYFDSIDHRIRHREFHTHTGRLGNRKISVISTGIGTDNIDIVLNELDALFNIDFNSGIAKPNPGSLQIIRLGTCGSLQADIEVDSFVVSTHGLGIDNMLNFYRFDHNEEQNQLLHAFLLQTQISSNLANPYLFGAAPSLLKAFAKNFHQGITVSCPGFYGPQGRVLRLGLRDPHLVERFSQFQFGPHRITNFEMETAGIYGLGKLLGHHCISLSAILANRIKKEFSKDANRSVERLIVRALEIIAGL